MSEVSDAITEMFRTDPVANAPGTDSVSNTPGTDSLAPAKQTIQESEYEFPYHYIPTLVNGNFSQVRKLRWGYEYLSYLRFVLSTLEKLQFNSLLDVGCGEGRFLSEVAKRFPD